MLKDKKNIDQYNLKDLRMSKSKITRLFSATIKMGTRFPKAVPNCVEMVVVIVAFLTIFRLSFIIKESEKKKK